MRTGHWCSSTYFYEQGNHERCIDILQRKCKIRRQCNSVFNRLSIIKLLLVLAITWSDLKSLVCKIFKKEKTQTKRGVKFDSVSNSTILLVVIEILLSNLMPRVHGSCWMHAGDYSPQILILVSISQ